MAEFTVSFERRDFSGAQLVPGLRFGVTRLNWRAVGGPWSARLTATAQDVGRLWGVVDLLRCPVRVNDQLGPAWWGYVSAVELQHGAERMRVSLDEMANRVGVRFDRYTPTDSSGQRQYTPFLADAGSIATYGAKERMFLLGESGLEDATAYAKTMLARVRMPIVTAGSASPEAARAPGSTPAGKISAVIECRGWWETPDWRFAAEPRGRIAHENGNAQYPLASGPFPYYASWFNMGSAPWRIGEIWYKLRRVGNPGAGLQAVIWGDNGAGAPVFGGIAGSFTVQPSEVPDSLGWVRFPFAGTYQPPANTKLWAGIYRVDYGSDGANYYQIGLDQFMGAAENTVAYNGAWVPPAPDGDMARIILGVEETTEQARLVLSSSVSQFLTGARIEKKSGVAAPLFRNGSERGRAVVERLLKLGTSTGSRLLARVEPNRYARIYEQPAAESARLRLDAAGRLRYLNRRPLEPSEWAAGEWARAGELGAAGGLYGYDGAVFVEACSWDAERGLYVVAP